MFGFDDDGDFEREYKKATRMLVAVWIVSAVIGFALTGGAIYLVIKTLLFFGIL